MHGLISVGQGEGSELGKDRVVSRFGGATVRAGLACGLRPQVT
jgi:hypothetical protein